MTAFKCDRCGYFYEPYNYYGSQNDSKANSIETKSGMGSTVKHYDICPSCMEAFEEFLQKGRGS